MTTLSQTFILSGIADEAGQDIDSQIEAHRELGWKYIELRVVDGVQFTDVPDDVFNQACEKLAKAGLKVSAFASGIANWGTKITDPFENSVETLKRAISRMHTLDVRFIRVMSYPNNGLSDEAWRDESVRRLQKLGEIANDHGIVLLVENCDGWASTSAENYGNFFELAHSPAVKTVYDTGNPASHGHDNTWDWYLAARPHIAYVHIKAHSGSGGKHEWPDAGFSKVRETLQDLRATGYNGFVSIEPHIQSEVPKSTTPFAAYVEYGRRLMQLIEQMPVR